MKRLKIIPCSLLFVLAAVGCSQDELADSAASEGKTQQTVITFDMGTRAEVQTRSAVQRPVVSSDDWQRVTDVRIYAFVSDDDSEDGSYHFASGVFGEGKDCLYVSDFAETKKDWTDDDVWGDDREKEAKNEAYTITVNNVNVEPGKFYKFLAIGRDDIREGGQKIPGENGLRGAWNNPTDWDKNTTLATASLTCSGGIACSEMFSGCSEAVHIKGPGEYSSSICLKRIVAGVMMYVENVPATIGEKAVHRISICPVQYMEGVLLAQDMAEGGHGKPADGDYTVNQNTTDASDKYPFAKEYVSADFRDGSGIPNSGIETENGCFTGTDPNSRMHPNSVLAGNFVLPQADGPLTSLSYDGKTIEGNSLYLVFWTQESSQELNLRSTAEGAVVNGTRNEDYRPIYWIPIKINGTEGLEGEYKFPLLGNHFYSLGLYNEEKGDNEPIDLSNHDFEKGSEGIVPTLRVFTPAEVWPALPCNP